MTSRVLIQEPCSSGMSCGRPLSDSREQKILLEGALYVFMRICNSGLRFNALLQPIALMMTASIGDLFLFLRQSRSPLLTELSSKMAWFQGSQNANSAQVSTKTKVC